MAGAYHYLYGRVDRDALDEPGDTPRGAPVTAGAGNGRTRVTPGARTRL